MRVTYLFRVIVLSPPSVVTLRVERERAREGSRSHRREGSIM